jgi:uncharacterized protein
MHINTEFDGQFIINSYSATEIEVNLQPYQQSFIITPDQILPSWNIESFDLLSKEDLTLLLTDTPEVCLLGTGETHKSLPVSLLSGLIQQGIALEVMSTPAACRTFNVLSNEGRRVCAGFVFD